MSKSMSEYQEEYLTKKRVDYREEIVSDKGRPQDLAQDFPDMKFCRVPFKGEMFWLFQTPEDKETFIKWSEQRPHHTRTKT